MKFSSLLWKRGRICKLEWSELRCGNEDCVWIRKTILFTWTIFIHHQHFSRNLSNRNLVLGTQDITHKGCPFALTAQKKKMMKTAYKTGYGVWILDGPIVYSLWKDTKVVCEASTIHTGNSNHMGKKRVKKMGWL